MSQFNDAAILLPTKDLTKLNILRNSGAGLAVTLFVFILAG
jgi:hypothetical protein